MYMFLVKHSMSDNKMLFGNSDLCYLLKTIRDMGNHLKENVFLDPDKIYENSLYKCSNLYVGSLIEELTREEWDKVNTYWDKLNGPRE